MIVVLFLQPFNKPTETDSADTNQYMTRPGWHLINAWRGQKMRNPAGQCPRTCWFLLANFISDRSKWILFGHARNCIWKRRKKIRTDLATVAIICGDIFVQPETAGKWRNLPEMWFKGITSIWVTGILLLFIWSRPKNIISADNLFTFSAAWLLTRS